MSNDKKEREGQVIKVSGVTKNFYRVRAVDDISFSVDSGSVFALMGENGAGKTTTIRMMLGLTLPDKGKLEILGLDPRLYDRPLRKRVGYISEVPVLYEWMTVEEIGRFAAAFYTTEYLPEYLRLTESFVLPLKAQIKTLSKGMKAEVSLIMALAMKPELLILDEPTSGLDAVIRQHFLDRMRQRANEGGTVFLSSHQIAEVERVADHVALMKKGHIIVNESLSSLKQSSQKLVLSLQKELPEMLRNDSACTDLFPLLGSLFELPLFLEWHSDRLEILGRNLVSGYREYLAPLEGMGINVEDSRIVIPSLEELFLGYMRQGQAGKLTGGDSI